MPDAFFKETFRRNRPLFNGILRLNLPGSGDFAPGRLPGEAARLAGEGLLRSLEVSPGGARRVRAYLLGQCRGANEESFFFDFRDERRRLALLAPSELLELMTLFGGCVHAPQIALAVRRQEVLELRETLGRHYDYVLLRGRFQLARARRCFEDRYRHRPLPERIRLTGRDALRVCMADWPEALRQLAGSRLPENPPPGWPEGFPSEDGNAELVWSGLKKLLLKEVAPTWRNCFA
ncbi:hypothetical protein LJC15_03695 [Desulfovibrio sp. OttesenSCG-928-G11]|nr:hypothetical protein [Desulfovibrio sp. OttesenSCG-928-G11]